jgi:RHS repeat-associated protein
VEELSSSGTFLAKYTHGLGIDEPLAMNRAGSNSYYNADGLGTITSLIDGSGSAVASYTYDAYGNITASAGSVVNPFRYTGREWDSETGLYYYRARYYDPQTGRFVNEDPFRFGGGIDFYAYADNDPSNLFDPTGWASSCDKKQKTPCNLIQRYKALKAGSKTIANSYQNLLILGGVGLVAGPESGGAGTALAVAYGVWNLSGRLTAGTLQIVGGITCAFEETNDAAKAAETFTTVLGITTFFATGGDLNKAHDMANYENDWLKALPNNTIKR